MKTTTILLIALSALFINIGFANPNYVVGLKASYDKQHNLISPDKILLAKAIKHYQSGYNESAMIKFKQAAAFGNTQAQKFIGLMYIKSISVKQNWAIGYAWIKLAALDSTKEHIELRNKIFANLKENEKIQSEKEYKDLAVLYDQSAALKRRIRWVNKQKSKTTGSRVGSQTVNVQSQALNGSKLDNNRTGKITDMESFVSSYNFGIVTAGEIKEVNSQ